MYAGEPTPISGLDCPAADVLAAFAAGELAANEVGTIELHISVCGSCVDAVGWLGRIDTPDTPVVGSVVGRYQVLEEVGRGTFGIVFAAHDPELDRRVALKLLHRHTATDEERIVAEARAMAQVSSPHVLSVHDIIRVNHRTFVAMELVDGSTLATWLAAEPRPHRHIVDAFVQAGRGLAAAHEAGIIHRDFKPDNVLVRSDDRVAVTDFGLAGSFSPTPAVGLVGTPMYMAPEAIRCEPIDARADVFSFCVALYEGIYREHPFPARDIAELLEKIERVAQPPSSAAVPRNVREIVLRGLRFDRDERPQMAEVLRELERAPRRTRVALVGFGVASIAAALIARAALFDDDRRPTCEARAGASLIATWGDPQRAAVRAGFQRSTHPLARATIDRVERLLDAYGASWKVGSEDACRAREQRRQSTDLLERRDECVDRRRERWSLLVDRLSQPDDAAVINATTAAYALPSVESCADERWLAKGPAPLADARSRTARNTLAQAQVLSDLGDSTAGLALIATPLAVALESGDRGLEAEARLIQGDLQRAIDPRGAEKPLHAAAMAASSSGREDLEAAAKVLMVQTLAHSQLRLAEVALAADYAAALVMRLELPTLLADYTYARALAEWTIGGAERSLPLDVANLANQLLVHGTEHPKIAEAENCIAVSLVELEAVEASLPLARSALERRRRLQGDGHPETLNAMGNLAFALAQLGRFEEALPMQEAVAEGRARTLGADYFLLDETYVRLARLYQWELDRSDDALRVIRRACAIDDATFGQNGPEGVASRTHLARILIERGERSEAEIVSAKALAIAESNLPDTHLVARMALAARGYVLERTGRCSEATPLFDRLEVAARTMASGADERVLGLTAHARCDLAARRPELAEQRLRTAVAIRERTRGSTSPMLADVLVELSAFYRATRRRHDAIEAASRAVACRKDHPGVVLERARRELERASALLR